MKKTLYTLFFCGLFIQACTTDSSNKLESKETEITETTEIPDDKYPKREYSDSIARYVVYDSAEYRITQKYYHNADLAIFNKLDTFNKINYKTYYRSDTISYFGQFIHPNNIKIGKWHRPDYSPSFIDANYDDSSNVNYWEAMEIASKKGFNFPNIEVSISIDSSISTYCTSWIVYRVNDTILPQSILIDCETGEVVEFEYNIGEVEEFDYNIFRTNKRDNDKSRQ